MYQTSVLRECIFVFVVCFFIFFGSSSCGGRKGNTVSVLQDSTQTNNFVDTNSKPSKTLPGEDRSQSNNQVESFKVSHRDTDVVSSKFFIEELKSIRKNYHEVNSIDSWTRTIKIDLDESTEGGEAVYFFTGNALRKIIAKLYGETFQQINEYYLLNGKLSFVFEKQLKYNRPMYYDSTVMKENGDNESFDIRRSQYEEDRSYFINDQLVHQQNNQDCGAPFAKDYMKEQEIRILNNYRQLHKHLSEASAKNK